MGSKSKGGALDCGREWVTNREEVKNIAFGRDRSVLRMKRRGRYLSRSEAVERRQRPTLSTAVVRQRIYDTSVTSCQLL